jgi:hypothetical protein
MCLTFFKIEQPLKIPSIWVIALYDDGNPRRKVEVISPFEKTFDTNPILLFDNAAFEFGLWYESKSTKDSRKNISFVRLDPNGRKLMNEVKKVNY